MKYIILDTETTGLNANVDDRIIEIGCLEMQARHITNNSFHVYLNPERDVPLEATRIHGITSDFVKDKPLFKDEVENFLAFIRNTTLIIHNASFDIGFLNAELARLNLGKVTDYVIEVIDSLKYARQQYPGRKNSLDALCDRLEIDRSNRGYHGALLDANLLAKVWLAMTAGQDELFENESKQNQHPIESSVNQQVIIAVNIKDNGLVHQANEAECLMHQTILTKMKVDFW
jgi:DNA polymerase III subunit epsilon